MNVIKMSKVKIAVILVMVFAMILPFVASSSSSLTTVKAEDSIEIVETEVKGLVFKNVSGGGFLGFELTQSDYSIEGIYGDLTADKVDYYSEYANYIAKVCTYWESFKQMNSAKAYFKNDFIYWDKGTEKDYVGVGFEETIVHPFSLANLSFGFTVEIPAGTRFPSYEYVKGGLVGKPKVYQTKTDKAFYYDGTRFVEIPFTISQEKAAAYNEIDLVDLSLYNQEEKLEVENLKAESKERIAVSFSSVEIASAMNSFRTSLDKIMTIADYQMLEDRRSEAKTELEAFFGGLKQDDYDADEWSEIVAIKNQSTSVIDSIKKIEDLSLAVAGIKNSANGILTKDEKVEFEAYRSNAITELEDSFDPSIYSDEEKALGEGFVAEGKKALASAKTYDEVDALWGYYTAKISELTVKTDKEEQSSATSESESYEEEPQGIDWRFALVGGVALVVGVAVVVVLIVLKNKNKERKGERNEK